MHQADTDDRTGDFPYYRGHPTAVTGVGWLLVIATVVLGFLALTTRLPLPRNPISQFVPAIAFCAIPLVGLALVAGRHWTAIFRPVGWRDIGWMVAVALLNLVVSLSVAAIVTGTHGASSNPVFATLASQSPSERALLFLKTLPQLLGEEVVTILPLLALLWLFHSRLKLGRTAAIILAWFLSSIWFGLLHLPTYQWDLVQCLVVIGSARMVLSLAYLKTKNIWVSAGAHVINDWAMFGASLLLTAMARQA